MSALPAVPTIPTFGVGDDLVILLDALALVSSKSTPGAWRPVDLADHLCGCPAFVGIPGKFEGRGRCRHVDAVRAAEAKAAPRLELVR